jgi:hypothetical protein
MFSQGLVATTDVPTRHAYAKVYPLHSRAIALITANAQGTYVNY